MRTVAKRAPVSSDDAEPARRHFQRKNTKYITCKITAGEILQSRQVIGILIFQHHLSRFFYPSGINFIGIRIRNANRFKYRWRTSKGHFLFQITLPLDLLLLYTHFSIVF